MRVYRVSPIVQYSPFYRLTYFSKFDFKIGNICEIDFNKRKLFALVVEVLELSDAKVEIRKGNFTTKKIETKLEKKDEQRFSNYQFKLIEGFADRFLVSVGEVVYALDHLHKQKKFKDLFDKNGEIKKEITSSKEIVINDFDIEKYTQYQAPHISLVHLLILYVKVFNIVANLVFKTNFLGTSEKFFLDTLDIPYKLEEDSNQVKRFLYKKSNKKFESDDINNQEKILDDNILKAVKEAGEKKDKTFIFVLAHGYQSSIFCKDCKSGYNCEECGHNFSILNEQENTTGEDGFENTSFKRYLFCKNCENKKPLKEDQYLICKKCGSWGLFPFGEGGQRIYEELLGQNLDKEDICFIDESQKKFSSRKLNDEVQNWLNSREQNILLGTRRVLGVLKYELQDKEKYKKLQTIVVSLGPISSSKNFDGDEKFIKLLSELESISSKIYIGKDEKENSVLDRYRRKEQFVKEELELRKKFDLPPYTNVVSFAFDWKSKKLVDKYLNYLKPVQEAKKGNKLIYHFILSGTEIRKNQLSLESLRQFGELLVSSAMSFNFIKRK